MSRPTARTLPADLRGQRAGDNQSFFIFGIVNVHRGTFAMCGQRTAKSKHQLSISTLTPDFEHLAGMPVLQPQCRGIGSGSCH
jgi:hypothetical protein